MISSELTRANWTCLDVELDSDIADSQFSSWLLDASLSLHSAPSLEGCLDLCLRKLEDVVDYDLASVAFLDGRVLFPAATRGTVGDTGRALRSPDVRKPPFYQELFRLRRPVAGSLASPEGSWLMVGDVEPPCTWVAVPLAVQDVTIGQMVVCRRSVDGFQ